MQKTTYILLILMTFSWFTSLVEARPCDSETTHTQIAELHSKKTSIGPVELEKSVASDAAHDCHAGFCHFGHCSHGYTQSYSRGQSSSSIASDLLLTPYRFTVPSATLNPLMRPPVFT